MESYIEKMRLALKPKRFEHSVGTMETAVRYAKAHNYDEGKAALAGILHDCAKNIDKDTAYEMCHKYNIELDDVVLRSPGLVHQYLGAAVAMDKYGITDAEILSAIRCHTTGKVSMSTLDKIIYLADFTEPHRDEEPFDGLDKLRELCMENLDKAMLFALDTSIKLVLNKGGLLHPATTEARNYYLTKNFINL